jgi:hypothetical protein
MSGKLRKLTDRPAEYTDGPELKSKITKLGLTVSAFSRESGISITSLKKIFANIYVNETTRNKAWVAYQRLERRLKGLLDTSSVGIQVS